MIVYMACGCVLRRKKISCCVRPSHAEGRVRPEPVLLEIEIVLNEQRAAKGVISDAIAPDPWIDERQGEDEKKSENFVVAREPSQSASSLNDYQFCSRPESPRGCDCPTRLLLC